MAKDSTGKNTKSHDKDYHKPSTVEDMTERNVQTIVRLEEAAKAVANFCGSMPFV